MQRIPLQISLFIVRSSVCSSCSRDVRLDQEAQTDIRLRTIILASAGVLRDQLEATHGVASQLGGGGGEQVVHCLVVHPAGENGEASETIKRYYRSQGSQ